MKKLVLTLLLGVTTLTAFAQVPSYVPTNGLVGYWPFNGNAQDESGNLNHGTVNGATLTSDRNGVANKAYSFDGSSSFIDCGNSSTISTPINFTFSVWINPSSVVNRNSGTNINVILSKYYDWNGYILGIVDEQGEIRIHKNPLTKNARTSKLSINNWVHLVAVKDDLTLKIYLNDILIQTTDITSFNPSMTSPRSLIFGKASWNSPPLSDGYFNGKIDDVAFFNRVLSQQEITALYYGCTHETATTNSLNGIILKNAQPINLTASPSLDGQFSGDAISNNKFTPANAHLGKNTIHYNFTNSSGCKDSTDFSVIVYDTLGNVCSTYDTLKIKVKFTLGLYANTINTIKFYPNPTKDVLIIDNGNYQAMSGYSLKIVSLAGKVVYNQPITSQQVQISMNQIATKGLYIAQIVDSNNAIVDSKKIVLE